MGELALARQGVWELLIEEHGLSFDNARKVVNQVGNELRAKAKAEAKA